MTARSATTLLETLRGNVTYHPGRGDTIYFAVHCVDMRRVFNRLDILISPEKGSGQMWVAFDSLVIMGNANAIRAALDSLEG